MNIGGELRTARKARMLSLDDIARATKINPPVLRALESNAFDRIPRGIFTRGYLRAFAREVGLDPDDLVQRFRAEFDVPEEPEGGARGDTIVVAMPSVATSGGERPIGSIRSQIVQIGVIVIAAAVCLAILRPSNPTATAESLPADSAASVPSAAAAVPVIPAAVPVSTAGSLDIAQAQLTIEIRPHGPCWVEATVDGRHSIARLMVGGERVAITVRDDLTLLVGDPSVFAFSIDGVEGRRLSRGEQPVTVRINPRNYGTFLARPRG